MHVRSILLATIAVLATSTAASPIVIGSLTGPGPRGLIEPVRREAAPEPARKGHFGGPEGKREAEAEPEPTRKGHFGGPEDKREAEAEPEPARKGHFGAPEGKREAEAEPEPARKGHFGKI